MKKSIIQQINEKLEEGFKLEDWEIEIFAKKIINARGNKLYDMNYINDLLFKQYKKDLDNGLDRNQSSARTLLLLSNNALIEHILKAEFNIYNSDEYLYAGKLALINAVDKYRLGEDSSFANFAYVCIKRGILQELKRQDRQKNKLLKTDPIENIEQNIIVDEVETIDRKLINESFKKFIAKNLKYFNLGEQITLILYFGLFNFKQMNCIDIAKSLDVSRQAVTDNVNSVLKKLRILYTPFKSLSKEDKKVYIKLKNNSSYSLDLTKLEADNISSLTNQYDKLLFDTQHKVVLDFIENYGEMELIKLFKYLSPSQQKMLIYRYKLYNVQESDIDKFLKINITPKGELMKIMLAAEKSISYLITDNENLCANELKLKRQLKYKNFPILTKENFKNYVIYPLGREKDQQKCTV